MDTPTSAQRRGGRPTLDPRHRRSERAVARVSPTERERLDRAIAESGLTESEYVRRRLGLVEAAAA